MDIVTHAMMGMVVAGPWIPHSPAVSLGFVFGSVMPDLDVLSRLFGKHAFLQWHQTFTHSIGAAIVLGLLALALWFVNPFAAGMVLGCLLGMLFHCGLDLSNTFGVKCLFPFSSKRYATEWMFFLDLPIIVLTVACLIPFVYCLLWLNDFVSPWVSIGYCLALAAYIGWRSILRRRAGVLVDESVLSLIPSAFVPWQFLGYAQSDFTAQLWKVDVLKRKAQLTEEVDFIPPEKCESVASLAEFKAMRNLSAGYQVVSKTQEASTTKYVCRDLRTRNFGTSFGRLEVSVDSSGKVTELDFKV